MVVMINDKIFISNNSTITKDQALEIIKNYARGLIPYDYLMACYDNSSSDVKKLYSKFI